LRYKVFIDFDLAKPDAARNKVADQERKMELTRRKVLTLGALTAASAATPFAAFAGMPAPAKTSEPATSENGDVLSQLTAVEFKPWEGSVFDVQSDTQSALVVLSEVQDPPRLPKNASKSKNSETTTGPVMKAFALRFQFLSGDALDQGTYTFSNGALGKFLLFIVPSGAGSDPVYYTAFINRLA
jgi:hypothetical protein